MMTMKPTRARNIDHAEYEIIQFLLEFKDLDPLQKVMGSDEASHDRWTKAASRLKARLEKRQMSLVKSLPPEHKARK
tara:strand:+ start:101 stop:331 length:231 start_codon:yes stop_codon:yes gene_type:complete